MEGAPSSVDIFDPKPELTRRDGQRIKIDVFNGNPGPLMKSPFSFKQYGESGAWFCEHYTNVARHADDFAFVKSFYSESNDHVPALYQINTGIPRPGFPSAGSWVTFGLGSENKNLPGYVVLGNNQGVKGGNLNWSSGFLPSTYQGTLFRPDGAPVINLTRPADVPRDDQRKQLDLLATLNARHLERHPEEAEMLGRIESFELAYRMQMEATDLVEPQVRIGRDPRAVRSRSEGDAVVRLEMPARPPARRARSAVRPGLQRWRVGRTQRPERQSQGSLPRHRSTHPCPSHGPEAHRPLRQHARHLGWGIRSHARLAGQRRSRSQPKWFRHVHGWCRDQGRCHLTAS